MSKSKVVIKDGVWKALRAKFKNFDKAHVKVGVLASHGGNATHDDKSGISLIELWAIHEFGSPAAGIPERRPLQRTFEVKKNDLHKIIAQLVKAMVNGKLELPKALAILGLWGATEVKKTIIGGVPPPNAPSTIAHKGSDKPLIDTGRMMNSVSFEVVV